MFIIRKRLEEIKLNREREISELWYKIWKLEDRVAVLEGKKIDDEPNDFKHYGERRE